MRDDLGARGVDAAGQLRYDRQAVECFDVPDGWRLQVGSANATAQTLEAEPWIAPASVATTSGPRFAAAPVRNRRIAAHPFKSHASPVGIALREYA